VKHKTLVSILAGLLIAAGTYYWWINKEQPSKRIVALVMTLSHPALEQVRKGFIADQPSDIHILDFNAEGSMQSAHVIARQIAHNSQIVGILAIGTLAAQSIAKVEKKRPIIISAVSDPVALFPDPKAYENICGFTDSINAAYQIDTIISMLPGIKSISFLYSPHEANSASAIKNLSIQAALKNLQTEFVGVYEPQQVVSAAQLACQKSDVVLVPLDNQLVAAMPSVIKATKNEPCAVITSNESPIHQGASIAFGVDYEKSGREAWLMMQDIIGGNKTPREIGFINPEKLEIYINKRVAREKNIKLNHLPGTQEISGE